MSTNSFDGSSDVCALTLIASCAPEHAKLHSVATCSELEKASSLRLLHRTTRKIEVAEGALF